MSISQRQLAHDIMHYGDFDRMPAASVSATCTLELPVLLVQDGHMRLAVMITTILLSACRSEPPARQILQEVADALARGDQRAVCRHVDVAETEWQHDWNASGYSSGRTCADCVAHIRQVYPSLVGGHVPSVDIDLYGHGGVADARFTLSGERILAHMELTGGKWLIKWFIPVNH